MDFEKKKKILRTSMYKRSSSSEQRVPFSLFLRVQNKLVSGDSQLKWGLVHEDKTSPVLQARSKERPIK